MKLTAPPLVNDYEIEQRVAVEVMGLPLVEFGERTKCPYCGDVGRMGNRRIWCCNCCEWYMHPYKNYRDNLHDAMEVIDAMRGRGFSVEMKANSANTTEKEWSVLFHQHGRRTGTYSGYRPNLGEAICQAALKGIADLIS